MKVNLRSSLMVVERLSDYDKHLPCKQIEVTVQEKDWIENAFRQMEVMQDMIRKKLKQKGG